MKDTAQYAALGLVGVGLLNNSLLGMSANYPKKDILSPDNPDFYGNFPMFPNINTTVQLKGKPVKVHGLCAGTASVKQNFRTKNGLGGLAKLNILFGKQYTEYMPIWVWVIEHPEGMVVIDTGEQVAALDLDKHLSQESGFARYQFKHAVKIGMSEKDELAYQFDTVGLKIEDAKLVIITHLHLDHTDGLKFFPKQEIIVGAHEHRHPNLNMPSTYPKWFKPNPVAYKPNQVEIFESAYPITQSGDLLYIPTPGHTHGHSSVIFKTDDFDIIFAGDTSTSQRQLLEGELVGGNMSYKKTRRTYQNLLAYAKLRNTIYLPSHDVEAGQRLQNRSFLKA